MLTRTLAAMLIALLAGLTLVSTTPSVHAATLTVDTLDDELNSDGDCSLREAITATNDNVAVDACSAGETGEDIITFSVTGTIALSETLPTLLGDLTLDGPDTDDLVLNGSSATNLLIVDASASINIEFMILASSMETAIFNGGTLEMSHVTLSGNNAQPDSMTTVGAIVNEGTLLVSNSVFRDNLATFGEGVISNSGDALFLNSTFVDNSSQVGIGAIANSGTMLVQSSTFERNSGEEAGIISNGGTLRVYDSMFEANGATFGEGVIGNSGTLEIKNSLFVRNSAPEGAGVIRNRGSASIDRSVFRSNSAAFSAGGAIRNEDDGTLVLMNSTLAENDAFAGGAIYNTAVMTVSNSTIVSNLADEPSAGIDNFGTLTLINSTVARNRWRGYDSSGVGIYNEGQVELRNTIVAEHADNGQGADCAGESVTSLGHNLDSDGSCNLSASGDVSNGNANLADVVADNGGATPTLALLPGSDAIDAGDNGVCAASPINNLDQRVLPRPVDGDGDGSAICDIGAYEVQETPEGSSITIALDAQPDSHMDLEFQGDLGYFRLDDIASDDGDDFGREETFEPGPGVYAVRQKLHRNFVLEEIVCSNDAAVEVDLAGAQVTITLEAGSHITCTFVNLRRSIVRSVSYKDNNQNGTIEAFEVPLNQWRVSYYDAEGNFYTGSPEGPTTNNLTNQQGKDGISNIPPGEYTICEEVKPGWFNTLPATVHPVYGQPCYEVTAEPGKIVEVYFGNTDYPLANRAQADASSGVIVRDAPDTEDGLDDEEWLNTPLQQPGLFMPLITSE